MSALQEKMNRLDALLDRKLADREAEQAREDASLEDARRQRQRANAEARREIAARYDSAYQSFGTTVPEAADDEPVQRYRARLFDRLARRLPETNEWATVRADNLPSGIAFDNVEKLVLESAVSEGLRPSFDNLPPDGSEISRVRVDPNTNERSTNFYSRRSFIHDFSRPGQRVLRFLNPKTGDVLFGPVFPRAR
jgi:hypothetical protein